MRRLIYIAIMLVFGITASAQSLQRQVIGTAGSDMKNADVKFSATIGEAVDDNYVSGSFDLLQGFQQPLDMLTTSITDKSLVSVDYKIYPNPVSDNLYIDYSVDEKTTLTLQVVGNTGKTMINRQLEASKGQNRLQLNVSTFPNGVYHLIFKEPGGAIAESSTIEKMP